MIEDYTLFGKIDKVDDSIKLLQEFEPEEGYKLAFSGGKDSIVIYDLAEKANVKYKAFYSLTTADPPELVKYIKEYYPKVEILKPEISMWRLIVKKRMPPTRFARYCCSELKEKSVNGFIVTGIRKDESNKRAKRKKIEFCYKDARKRFLHPIFDWTNEDVWEYINKNKIRYCSLYDEGFKRLGCVLCPMQTKAGKKRDIERWPKIADNYLRALKKAMQKREMDGLGNKFDNEKDWFDWWVNNESKKNKMQNVLFE